MTHDKLPGDRPVLLWDVMDTLVHDPFFDVMPAFFGMTLDEMLKEKHPDAWLRFEVGQHDEAGYLEQFFRDGRDFDHAAFTTRVRAGYRWLSGMEALLTDLHAAGNEMHALSNYPIWYQWIEQRCSLSRFLRWSFVSCHTGVRKPSPQAFLGAAQALNRAPRDCLFIDDRASNCRAAESVGMTALRFQGDVDALRTALVRHGCLRG